MIVWFSSQSNALKSLSTILPHFDQIRVEKMKSFAENRRMEIRHRLRQWIKDILDPAFRVWPLPSDLLFANAPGKSMKDLRSPAACFSGPLARIDHSFVVCKWRMILKEQVSCLVIFECRASFSAREETWSILVSSPASSSCTEHGSRSPSRWHSSKGILRVGGWVPCIDKRPSARME